MSSANDNQSATRKIRDGLLNRWSKTDLTEVSSDDALLRLSEARNVASKSANRFMLFAAAISFLYFLRLNDVGSEINIGQYALSELPFGLFVLSSTSLGLSTVALIRSGDSHAFDRYLRLCCEHHPSNDCELQYITYPNESAWGEPFSKSIHAIDSGLFLGLARNFGILLVNVFLLGLTLAPAVTGIDFIVEGRNGGFDFFKNETSLSIIFLLICNILSFLLISWSRLSDRR